MGIDRDRVVRTALRLLDEDGLDKLSLRRIATELDVKAPALYWHYANKRALLDHMADVMLAPVLPELAGPVDPDGWPEWLSHVADVLRAALLARPDGARVALGSNLTRAVAMGRFVERTVEVLHEAGFDLVDASRAAGTFIWFVVGRTVEEQSLPELDQATRDEAGLLFPVLSAAIAERTRIDEPPEAAFRYGVEIMITGLRTLRRELPD